MEYFISDFHFGHKSTLNFERFCFEDIQQHDNYIIKILKSKLTKDDTLYFLGDLGYPNEEIEKELRNLPCKKIMLQGNHDDKPADYYLKVCGFDEYYTHPIWLSNRIMLSHYPLPVENGTVNIHGHLHGSYLDMPNYVNVSIHVVNYKLISKKQIDRLISKLQPSYKFFFEWWNGHQIMTKEQIDNRDDILLDTDDKIVGFTTKGINNYQPQYRAMINKKQLLYRTVQYNNKQYTITDVSDDGLELDLVDMSNFEDIRVPLSEITVIEGYGRLYEE